MREKEKQLVYVIVAVIVILVALSIITSLLPKPLEIENLTPKDLNITEYNQNVEHFDIKSNVDKTWVNSIVKPKVANTNGNFLQVRDYLYPQPIVGKNGNSALSLDMPFLATGSEGNLLKYTVSLQLYANGTNGILDNKTITVTIKPISSISFPSTYSQGIKFDNLSTKSIQIKKGDNPTNITFDIVSTQGGTFSNIKVVPDIVNNKLNYLQSKEKDFDSITGNGQRIGSQMVSFQAIGSEGDEIDYQVYLDLQANGQTMDRQPISVTVLSK